MKVSAATLALAALAAPVLASGPGGGHGGGPGGPGGGHGGPGGGHGGPGGPGGPGRSDKPGKPGKYVTSEALQDKITLKKLLAGSNKLQEFADNNGGNRAFGSGGHNATVDYIVKTLEKTGYYDVYKQPLSEIFSTGKGTVAINGEPIEHVIMTYSPSGSVTGPLVAANNLGCTPEDYPAEVAGNVALVSRGTCSFGEKSVAAKAAGAVGVLCYNNMEGGISGTLGSAYGDYAAITGISGEKGAELLALLEQGPVSVDYQIDAIVETRTTYNVIAETKGGDHDNVLILGGHTDSVAGGPGINDDGSGTIGVLNVAVALSDFKVKNAVRFGFWTAEEFGLIGSYRYIESFNSSETELAKIRAYLNFDMIASPNYVYGIYDGNGDAFGMVGPDGSDSIEKLFEDFYDSKNEPHQPSEFSGRSDYAAFIQQGIPSGGVFTGAEVKKTEEQAAIFGGIAGESYDQNYHLAGDDIANLHHGAYLLNSKAIAHSVATYAMSWDSIPAVNVEKRRWDGDVAQHFKRKRDSRQHSHSDGPCGGGDLY